MRVIVSYSSVFLSPDCIKGFFTTLSLWPSFFPSPSRTPSTRNGKRLAMTNNLQFASTAFFHAEDANGTAGTHYANKSFAFIGLTQCTCVCLCLDGRERVMSWIMQSGVTSKVTQLCMAFLGAAGSKNAVLRGDVLNTSKAKREGG